MKESHRFVCSHQVWQPRGFVRWWGWSDIWSESVVSTPIIRHCCKWPTQWTRKRKP